MALKFGVAQRRRVAEVLETDHENLDTAVTAVLDLVNELVADRASFVVVGQLVSTRERLSVPPSDPEAIKVALGTYSTEGDARSAAESLWSSTASGCTFRAWWLPLNHGTPAEFHKGVKDKYVGLAAKAKAAQSERIKKQIEKRQAEAAERSRQMKEEDEAA